MIVAQSQIHACQIEFDDNKLLPLLFGAFNANLTRIEERIGVSLSARGNAVVISGCEADVEAADQTLHALYDRLKRGMMIETNDIDAAMRIAQASYPPDHPLDHPLATTDPLGQSNAAGWQRDHSLEGRRADDRAWVGATLNGDTSRIRTKLKQITPRSTVQSRYIQTLARDPLVFGIGPAGTGKTYLAVAMGVALLLEGRVDRLILSRPAVEAGERLGFLPGDLREKIDPYMRPLYDALGDMLPPEQIGRRIERGEIEVAPLAFMRGRTLSNAYVILDEAQNTTSVQMKMFLTRLGEGARMAITGDLSQVDLPAGTRSGLRDALELLEGVAAIGVVRFSAVDVVRHPLVARIIDAYAKRDQAVRTAERYEAPPRPVTEDAHESVADCGNWHREDRHRGDRP